jgi:hypothetical protein
MIAVPLCLFIQPLNAFELGAEAQIQQNRAIYGTVAADMLVGDRMRIPIYYFCQSEGRLMLLGSAVPQNQNEWSPDIIVTMLNGGRVSVTISADNMKKPDRQNASFYLSDCIIYNTNELLPISDVNSFTSLEAYLASDFFTDLPRP